MYKYAMKKQAAGWRRLMSILLVVSMVLSISPVVQADTSPVDSVEVTDAGGYPGDMASVAVYVTPDILIYQYNISLSYDAQVLELVSAAKDLNVTDQDSYTVDYRHCGNCPVECDHSVFICIRKNQGSYAPL
ncbi:cohesin domain-containing protein [Paenibacillus medicaginis]|uniref:Cohesin domain-containing protein n=1 Tax=Paenibacillus medicaginis TaxID=1470560 RepID=A0ABV5C803_9BACL